MRALRLYEEEGLISPSRSPGGWRLYGAQDLARINVIMLLKMAGLSLAQIRSLTRTGGEGPGLTQILTLQLSSWRRRREEAERGEGIAQAALQRLADGGHLSVTDLCELIRSLEMTQSETPAAADPQADKVEEISLDPAILDAYVGFYISHHGENGCYHIRREGGHLTFDYLIPMSFHPVSDREFAARGVDLRMRFEHDASDQVSGFVLLSPGQEVVARRIDAKTAQQLEERLAARIQSQSPLPGSEAALRKLLQGLLSGEPDYTALVPAYAQMVRRRLPQLQAVASYFGEVRSIEFEGVGRRGFDVYKVQRERGLARWRISLDQEGRILGAIGVPMEPLSFGP